MLELTPTTTTYQQARAAWRAAKAAAARDLEASLPPAMHADPDALRRVGLSFAVATDSPTLPPRELTAAEVANLDAADPRRTLYSYQKSFAAFNRPVPDEIVQNLRTAFRDMTVRKSK